MAAGNRWFDRRNGCPACDSTRFEEFLRLPYCEPPLADYLVDFYEPPGKVEFEYLEGADYILCECSSCRLVFQRDIPGDELMARLYEHWIVPVKREKRGGLASSSRYAQEIMQVIAYLGRAPSSLKFLDFGMGWGQWALMAKAFGCESYGTDLSLERIRHAQSNGLKTVGWDEIPDCRFDLINTEQVFEHLARPLETLRHLRRALGDGGIIKISVPKADDIRRRLRRMDWKAPKGSRNSLNPVAPLEHINLFRRAALLEMGRAAGLEEVRIPAKLQYRFATDWGGSRRIARNLMLPVYRNVLKRQNYVFFRKARAAAQAAA